MERYEFKFENKVETVKISTSRLGVQVFNSTDGKTYGEIEFEPNREFQNIDDVVVYNEDQKSLVIDSEDYEYKSLKNFFGTDSRKNGYLKLYVNENVAIKSETEVSSQIFKDVVGDIVASSDVGSINIENNRGNLDLSTEVGSVTVKEGSYDNMRIDTEVGSVTIDDCKIRELDVSTEVGSIKISNNIVEGMKLNTETGSITAYLFDKSFKYGNLSSEIGRIKLVIPEDLIVDLIAKTEMGKISSNLKNVLLEEINDGVRYYTKATEKDKDEEVCKISVNTELGGIMFANDPNEFGRGYGQGRSNRRVNRGNGRRDGFGRANGYGRGDGTGFGRRDGTGPRAQEGDCFRYDGRRSYFSRNLGGLGESISRIVNQAIDTASRAMGNSSDIHPQTADSRLNDNEKSRLKILELLENGKINQEEAEKLLKAIK